MIGRQNGVALVLVLWVITLLAVIAGNFAFSMHGEAQIARNLLSSAQAQAQADAGVQLAWFELTKPPTDALRWRGDAVVHEYVSEGALLRVAIQDESGKIDLNAASEPLLKGIFKSVGLGDNESTALVDAVQDWKDADKLRRLHGAEEDEYRAAGKRNMPSNAPFSTLNELQGVLGMTPDVYRKLAPSLTIYSGQESVNVTVAPRDVLMAIPGIPLALVEQYLSQRQSAIDANQRVPPMAFSSVFTNASAVMPGYTVRSEARMPDGTVFVRQAVIRLMPDTKRPAAVLAWGGGEAELLTEK
jgi:general secretion pathway protein K